MFTGIVTHQGRVATVEERDGRVFDIQTDMPLDGVELGASVAHSGVCLTVIAKGPRHYKVQASGETLARTTLRKWQVGDRINLERSLKLGDELGGHLVFGHVDAVGTVRAIDKREGHWRFEVGLPTDLAPLVAVKGSIAVDGVSLTVTEATADSFAVTVIPHTLTHTTLGARQSGDAVNLEADMLARYVARRLDFARES